MNMNFRLTGGLKIFIKSVSRTQKHGGFQEKDAQLLVILSIVLNLIP